MFREPKRAKRSTMPQTDEASQLSRARLHHRAALFAEVRQFFAERDVLEVETPILSRYGSTDLHLHSFTSAYRAAGQTLEVPVYLQTSPEFAMKRLLASGSGPIFQLCKCFRNGEVGRHHQPEFTLLEWYRPGFDHQALMSEVDAFLQVILGAPPAQRLSYQAVFEKYCDLNPHTATFEELTSKLRSTLVDQAVEELAPDATTSLQLLMASVIEPLIGQDRPTMVYDFPQNQAALARLSDEQPPRAQRFEVYYRGMELANGFHELTDAAEQRRRFVDDNAQRRARQLETVAMDESLIAALAKGLPDCSGVALGMDRLLMLRENLTELRQGLSFGADYIADSS